MTTIALGAQFEDKSGIRGLGAKWGRIQKEGLQDTARFYHATLFAKHFFPGNSSRYQFETRSEFYKKTIKPYQGSGQGKYVDLQLKGTSRRAMLALPQFTGTKTRAVIRMRPPSYFTNPFVGTFRDRSGKLKTIRRQPDKVKEVTTISNDERTALQNYLAKRINQLVAQARAAQV